MGPGAGLSAWTPQGCVWGAHPAPGVPGRRDARAVPGLSHRTSPVAPGTRSHQRFRPQPRPGRAWRLRAGQLARLESGSRGHAPAPSPSQSLGVAPREGLGAHTTDLCGDWLGRSASGAAQLRTIPACVGSELTAWVRTHLPTPAPPPRAAPFPGPPPRPVPPPPRADPGPSQLSKWEVTCLACPMPAASSASPSARTHTRVHRRAHSPGTPHPEGLHEPPSAIAAPPLRGTAVVRRRFGHHLRCPLRDGGSSGSLRRDSASTSVKWELATCQEAFSWGSRERERFAVCLLSAYYTPSTRLHLSAEIITPHPPEVR